MKAMVLEQQPGRLISKELPIPVPGPEEVLIKVEACGVCRTDLHIVDGELNRPKLPLIPGHEVVGTIVETGSRTHLRRTGERVGVPWLFKSCGVCRYCRQGNENLCEHALFTGYTADGGYAEFMTANENFIYPLPPDYDSIKAAPLLCAGLIGFRSYRMADETAGERRIKNLGLYGFGAAAHIIVQIAVAQGKEVFAFTKDGDREKQEFALDLGASWAGGSSDMPPKPLDAAIIFAPAGSLVPKALKALDKGGILVCAGIYMSDIPAFPYELLWWERKVLSVANLTRNDGYGFMEIASEIRLHTEITPYPLKQANAALDHLRSGRLKGAAVLIP